jgi:hypothetical protein
MSKGSKRRPMKIEVIKFDENWNAVFGTKKERAGEIFSKKGTRDDLRRKRIYENGETMKEIVLEGPE